MKATLVKAGQSTLKVLNVLLSMLAWFLKPDPSTPPEGVNWREVLKTLALTFLAFVLSHFGAFFPPGLSQWAAVVGIGVLHLLKQYLDLPGVAATAPTSSALKP